MNLLLVQPSERDGDTVVVRGRRAAHVRDVLKVGPGERVRIGVVRDSAGSAEVVSCDGETLVLENLDLEPAGPAPRLRLVIALPRPKALRRLLQTAASFQIEHIDLVNAWRVQKSYWDSPSVELAALAEELWLGCEQGRHVWLPTIRKHPLLMPFLSEEGAGSAEEPRFLAHPGSPQWLRDVDTGTGPATVAIGPEGGWIEKELESFEGCGYQKISVSRAILKSEIALAATLAQWELLTTE